MMINNDINFRYKCKNIKLFKKRRKKLELRTFGPFLEARSLNFLI